MNFNYFYHNNSSEFKMIKKKILEYKHPTDAQLAEWKKKHWKGGIYKTIKSGGGSICTYTPVSYACVVDEINEMAEYFLDDTNCECPQDVLECNGFSFVEYLQEIYPPFGYNYMRVRWPLLWIDQWCREHDLYKKSPRSIIEFECDWHISYWDESTQMYRVNRDVLKKICP